MWDRGVAQGIGLVFLMAVGACSSEMDPTSAGTMTGATMTGTTMTGTTTSISMSDSLSDLASVAGPQSALIIGTNAGALVATPSGSVYFYIGDPGTLASAAFAAKVPVCSVEMDALVIPAADVSEVGAALDAEVAKCNREVAPSTLAELRALQTPATVVIVGANAAETWHSTNNGVNYFYGSEILGMLHAARILNVTACVVAPADISLPTSPMGQTSGLSIGDALTGCELPP